MRAGKFYLSYKVELHMKRDSSSELPYKRTILVAGVQDRRKRESQILENKKFWIIFENAGGVRARNFAQLKHTCMQMLLFPQF